MGTSSNEGLVARIPAAPRIIAVEFPGYVRNVDRATRMLGGLDGITAAVNTIGDKGLMRVSFRPDDPTCHPLIGDQQPVKGLLLRISRKKRPAAAGEGGSGAADAAAAAGASGHAEPAAAAAAALAPKVEILAAVTTTFRFSGLADYQYLPVDPASRLRNQHVEREGPDAQPVPAENLAGAAEPSGAPEPLLVVPPLFAKSDAPMDYAFKQFRAPAAKGATNTAVQDVGFFCASVPQSLRPEAEAGAGAGAGAAVLPVAIEPQDPGSIPGEAAAAAPAPSPAPGSGADPDLESPPAALTLDADPDLESPPAALTLDAQLLALLSGRPILSRQLLWERLGDLDAMAHAAQEAAAAEASAAAAAGEGAREGAGAKVPARDVASAAAGTSAAAGEGAGAKVPAPPASVSPLQQSLVRHTYRFKTGPWRNLYIRRGYDPRQHPSSRAYQVLQYRLPATWYQQLGAAIQPEQDPRRPAPSMDALQSFSDLPTTRITDFQLCDLKDNTIVAQLSLSPESDKCTEADGWFQPGTLAELHSIVEARFKPLIDALSGPALTSPAAAPAAKKPKPDAGPKKKGRRKVETAGAALMAEAQILPLLLEGEEAAGATPADAEEELLPGDGDGDVAGGRLPPPSYLSTLIGQMALQGGPAEGAAAAGAEGDEYDILDASDDDNDDDDDDPPGFATMDKHYQQRFMPSGLRQGTGHAEGPASTHDPMDVDEDEEDDDTEDESADLDDSADLEEDYS